MTARRFSRRHPLYQQAKEQIRLAFPVLFQGERHPWAIGTYYALIDARPDFKTFWHSAYIRDYCHGEKYLRSLSQGRRRIDIHGSYGERPTEEAMELAALELKKKGK